MGGRPGQRQAGSIAVAGRRQLKTHDGDLVAGDGAVHAERAGKLVGGATVDVWAIVFLVGALVLDIGAECGSIEEHDLAGVGPCHYRDRGMQAIEALAATAKENGSAGEHGT
eukprot:scaffold14715_cov112-Isochrysis_galbana.AAC.4